MMNKIFVLLLVLTLAGAALLFWLLKSMPSGVPTDSRSQAADSTVVATREGIDVEKNPEHLSEKSDQARGQSTDEVIDLDSKTPVRASNEIPLLKIETEPVKAVVFVDGEMKGQTPIEFALKARPQQVKVEAPGFKELRREAPAIVGGMDLDTLTWKIVLMPLDKTASAIENSKKDSKPVDSKAVTPPVAQLSKLENQEEQGKQGKQGKQEAHAPVARENPADRLFLMGRSGPIWIQAQSFPMAEINEAESAIKNYRSSLNLNVMGCQVEIAAKGRWIRVLTGPFDSRADAQALLKRHQSRLAEGAFITGAQNCL